MFVYWNSCDFTGIRTILYICILASAGFKNVTAEVSCDLKVPLPLYRTVTNMKHPTQNTAFPCVSMAFVYRYLKTCLDRSSQNDSNIPGKT